MTKTQGEVRETLVEAQGLLKAGKYAEARRVLKPVQWHPTAQKWLKTIPLQSRWLRNLIIVFILVMPVAGAAIVVKTNNDYAGSVEAMRQRLCLENPAICDK